MPELPEVEVLRRSLDRVLPGRRIEGVVVRETRLREVVDVTALAAATVGRTIERLERRAKYLLIHLEGSSTLLVHLGMSGRLTVVPAEEPLEAHEHLAFLLGSTHRLRFRDPRRFGLIASWPTGRLASEPHLAGLGPEPLGADFDGQRLARAARRRRAAIKLVVMDPTVVVGVGNIYASEALHRAGIDPRRPANRIAAARLERLAEAIRSTLEAAIEQGGTTLSDFADGAGNAGYFQVALAVYDRDGETCPRCGGTIRRVILGQRSTYYCPGCQR